MRRARHPLEKKVTQTLFLPLFTWATLWPTRSQSRVFL